MRRVPIDLRRVFWHVAVVPRSVDDCDYLDGEEDYPSGWTVFGVVTRLDVFGVMRSGLPDHGELFTWDEEG